MKRFLVFSILTILFYSCHKQKVNPDDLITIRTYTFHSKIMCDSTFTFYIPSGFTPNGDGINEYWEPEANGYALDSVNYSLVIMDKGGDVVYSTGTPSKFYGQGKNGKILPQQTLIFAVEARDKILGDKYTFTGQFILLR